MKFPATAGVFITLFVFGTALERILYADEGNKAGMERSTSPDGAAVSFRNIKDGDVLPLAFTVEFRISGMGIAPAGTNIENTGHHHLLIDVETLPALDRPLPATDKIHHFGKGQSETELTLIPGQHTLQLLFADYVHIPHEPPVKSDKITVTVAANAPPQNDDENDDGEGP